MKKPKVKKVSLLIEKYPKIFAQAKLPMTQTCMCWGICTGDGWYDLLDRLCRHLQFMTDKNGYPQVEAAQVKEKYGTLRFYHDIKLTGERTERTSEQIGYIDGLISAAEHLSGHVCETCGSNHNVTQTPGWIVTLCEECMKKHDAKT